MSDFFHNKGYDTSWLHPMGAGSDRFGVFHRFHKVNNLLDGFQYPEDAESLGWAKSDKETFKMARKNIIKSKPPYYFHIQTQTNHGPFVVPKGYEKSYPYSNSTYNKFLNTMRYSDEEMGKFVEWYLETEEGKRSIIIVVADHGLPFPTPRNPKAWTNKIASTQTSFMIILPEEYGDIPAKVDTLGSQIDIFPTLLDIMGYQYPDLTYGYSLMRLRSTPRFAYYTRNGSEYILTEDSVTHFVPEKKRTTWDGSVTVGDKTERIDWTVVQEAFKEFNLWLYSLKNWNQKMSELRTVFKNPTLPADAFSAGNIQLVDDQSSLLK